MVNYGRIITQMPEIMQINRSSNIGVWKEYDEFISNDHKLNRYYLYLFICIIIITKSNTK